MRKTISNQKLLFDEIKWNPDYIKCSGANIDHDCKLLQPLESSRVVGSEPARLKRKVSGTLKAEQGHPPYWTYSREININSGIELTNVVVKNSQKKNSSETVFKSVKFTDFEITFDNGETVKFDIGKALNSDGYLFKEVEDGKIKAPKPDGLFQRGMKLTLVNYFNNQNDSGRCKVVLEIAIVFRGAANDIDPAGIPVGMIMWPQLAYTWYNDQADLKVTKFRGSVLLTTNNKMYSTTEMPSSHRNNVASLFTDSNTAFEIDLENLESYLARGSVLPIPEVGSRAIARFLKLKEIPAFWVLLFDYFLPKLSREKEIIAVYGPNTSSKWDKIRKRTYYWFMNGQIPQLKKPHFFIKKLQRQGYYDNIHVHAMMHERDPMGKVAIHAPFCGHSCIHLHWRWSAANPKAADRIHKGSGAKYRGWSRKGVANSVDGAPLVPPNQEIRVAVTNGIPQRPIGEKKIINAATKALNIHHKTIYYSSDIYSLASSESSNANIPSGESQVIFEHGVSWAYRYILPKESKLLEGFIRDLYALITGAVPDLIWPLIMPIEALKNPKNIKQEVVKKIFSNFIYPFIRYIPVLKPLDEWNDQIPRGTHADTDPPSKSIEMEKL